MYKFQIHANDQETNQILLKENIHFFVLDGVVLYSLLRLVLLVI